MDRWFPPLFGLALVLGGSAGHVVSAMVPAWQIRGAAAWDERVCTIERSEVVEGTNSDGDTTYRASLAYHHTEAGQRYRSTRISFAASVPTGNDAIELVRQTPVGARVPCWVDPARPGSSVLSRSGFTLAGGLIALGVQLVGLLVLWAELGGRDRKPRCAVRGGVLEVRPRWERKLLTVAGATLVAAQLAITAYALIGIDRSGAAAVYLAALALASTVGGHRLGQWLTGLRLTVTPTRISLGERAQVRWHLRAPFGVGGGHLRLIGRERVSRGSGSDINTETRELHRGQVARLDRAHNDRPVSMRIPADALPSLELERAQIEWVLEVRVVLPSWPDLDLEVPIEVAPRTVALPRPAPPRSSAPTVDGPPRLVLDRKDARYRPGQPITGVVGWTTGSPDTVQIELRRRVAVVDGDPPRFVRVVVEDVAQMPRIAAPTGGGPFRGVAASAEEGGPLARRELREVRLIAPDGPVSYQSKLLIISWHLAVVVDGGDVDERELQISA